MAGNASAYQPKLVYLQTGDVQITNPETSQTFYDELKGQPRDYFITSDKDFELDLSLSVPEAANRDGRYSLDIIWVDNSLAKISSFDGSASSWDSFYDNSTRDYYLKGLDSSAQLAAGKYKIEVYSKDNQGKYVLTVGKNESSDLMSTLNIYWQLPLLKVTFLKTSVLQFFLTPYGIAGIGVIGGILIILLIINYLVGLARETIKHNQAKTLLLTSAGMQMKNEIIKLLQKPAYDVTVAFITTAAKPEENLDYLQNDWRIMKELGFNVQEVDIEGKTEAQVVEALELKDIIFVEGGNTFYLLNAMRRCNFEKVIRKLLKLGKVYIGVSAGSIVAGKTIKTASWYGDKNIVKLSNLKGLNLVPFDIFVHYTPENAEVIRQKIVNPKKRAKNLKIITDEQAILVQGKEVDLIGSGEAVIV
jgi:dipeptidase E